jgi:hypothetical protein
MASKTTEAEPFAVKDCALIAIATGKRAHNLRELREHLLTVDADSIYHHFWGGLLRPRFDDPEYNNDFAAWAFRGLHDEKLAERLGMVDPTDFDDLEALRQRLIDIIEERLDESEMVPWSRPDKQFSFITTHLVVFDTHRQLHEAKDFVTAIPNMSIGSIFYHFIDARRRTPDKVDDFRAWLSGYGKKYKGLISQLADVDPFFPTLSELRDQLASLFKGYFGDSAS